MSVRWGVLGTAKIAARAFLPALAAAGGSAVRVGSRSPERGRAWAAEHGVARAGSYESVVEAAEVDAVYVALPNEQHVPWAAAAARAGKAVLCEKPLALQPEQVRPLLDIAPGALIWEAFVFPFHPQTERILRLLGEDLGPPREIQSEFHFRLGRAADIRLDPEHGGGALHDVGCYPIRLARLLFGSEPQRAAGSAWWTETGVDLETAAVVDFPAQRRLVLSAGMRRTVSTRTRVCSEDGHLLVTNPFHPTPGDGMELRRADGTVRTWPVREHGTAFEFAIRHIHDVLRGKGRPRYSVADASGQAAALHLVRRAIGTAG